MKVDGDNLVNTLKKLWSVTLEDEFNTFDIGSLFRNSGLSLVVGCQNGTVKIYELSNISSDIKNSLKPKSCLETKGGPIQNLLLHDVTRFFNNDVIVADSKGTVTVFCNEQILNRKSLSDQCLHFLKVEQNALGQIAIIASDGIGHISAFNPYEDLWNIRLADVIQLRGISATPYIKSLITADMMNSSGQKTSYIIATDNCLNLYLIHRGSIVMCIKTPSVITAMATGCITSPDTIETNNFPVSDTQVVLGSETGSLYVMSMFKVYFEEIYSLRLPIKQILCIQNDVISNAGCDTLLVSGNFNAVIALKDAKEIGRYETPDWVNTMVATDIDNDGSPEVIIGCNNNSIHALKLMST